MENAGFKWYYSLLVSLTVYTGAYQFVLVTLLSSGASILTMALTAFLMNSRQSFYALTFVDEFNRMGKRKLYMIHTMTDETYAVNCTLPDTGKEKQSIMFWVAFLSRCYWMVGAVAGGILGQIIPFDMTGIDFCMTALFVIIFIDQWEKTKNHFPALTGLADCRNCDSGFMLVGSWTAIFPFAVTYHSVSGACGVEYEEKVGKYYGYKIHINRNCGVGSCNICTEGTSIRHIWWKKADAGDAGKAR